MSQFFEEDRGAGVRIVSVHGDLDLLVVEEFIAVARAAIDHGPTLELDLADLSFIDSSGLGALVRIRKEAEVRGTSLTLTNVPATTRRLLEITGLAGTFDVLPIQS